MVVCGDTANSREENVGMKIMMSTQAPLGYARRS
jgi:hypothetical protein